MSDLKLTPPFLAMLERIEQHSGTLLMLAATASGGQDGGAEQTPGCWVCRETRSPERY
jgi:hypothetical protein